MGLTNHLIAVLRTLLIIPLKGLIGVIPIISRVISSPMNLQVGLPLVPFSLFGVLGSL